MEDGMMLQLGMKTPTEDPKTRRIMVASRSTDKVQLDRIRVAELADRPHNKQVGGTRQLRL
jgi:hypothetical protein